VSPRSLRLYCPVVAGPGHMPLRAHCTRPLIFRPPPLIEVAASREAGYKLTVVQAWNRIMHIRQNISNKRLNISSKRGERAALTGSVVKLDLLMVPFSTESTHARVSLRDMRLPTP